MFQDIKRKIREMFFYLVMLELLSRTVNRSRRRGKTQGIENPVQESQYHKNLIELACSVRTGKILVEFLFLQVYGSSLKGSVHKLAKKERSESVQ